MGRFSNLEGSGDQDSPVEPDISELPPTARMWDRMAQGCVTSHAKAMCNPICREQL